MKKERVGITYTFANKVLTKEETYELIERSQAGEEEATEKLVKYNGRLVTSVAYKLRSPYFENEDLIQLGMIGLLNAIEKFDPSREVRFATFAVIHIESSIRMFKRNAGITGMKVPRDVNILVNKIRAAKIEDQSIQVVADALKETNLEYVEMALELSNNLVTYLEDKLDEDSSPTLAGTIEGDVNLNWFSDLAVSSLVSHLKPQQQAVLNLGYVRDLPRSTIATVLGVSVQRVHVIEKTALKQLRERYTYEELVN